MPALDIYHDLVVNLLVHDGWAVTDEPLLLKFRGKRAFVDLAAEKVLFAERETLRIAVEVKSFVGTSPVTDLHQAIGQFVMYREALKVLEPERRLYLAVSNKAYAESFQDGFGSLLLEERVVNLLVFNITEERIVQWLPPLMPIGISSNG